MIKTKYINLPPAEVSGWLFSSTDYSFSNMLSPLTWWNINIRS